VPVDPGFDAMGTAREDSLSESESMEGMAAIAPVNPQPTARNDKPAVGPEIRRLV